MVKLINLSMAAITVIILLTALPSSSHAGGGGPLFPTQKTVVKMENLLASKATLYVNCRAKSVDLGAHQLPFNAAYAFGFTEEHGGTTVYTCLFKWTKQLKWFDIYVERRDIDTCGDVCRWVIKETGPCHVFAHPPFASRTQPTNTKCYSWNKP